MADYKATAAQLASIANAIRLKGGTSAALEYPSEWITAIQNLVPASGGGEITPADPTLEYKVTDTELISIANAIRAKAEISGQLEFPSEFISGINSIPDPGPQIVSWADGTGEQIAAMIQAAHAGTVDLQQDGQWAVGDVRTITISGFTGGGGVSVSQQDIDIVISSFDDYNNCGCVMQFDFKDQLSEGIRMNPTSTNIGGYGQSEMNTTTIPAMVNALPVWLKNLLIEFSVLASAGNKSDTIQTITGNKLALRSEIEIFGSATYSKSGEGSQIPYYTTTENRKKKRGHSGSYYNKLWWERSPLGINNGSFCCVSDNPSSTFDGADDTIGVAPFGCI